MPFPTSSPSVTSPTSAPRPARRIVPFLLAAAVLAACAATLGSTAGLAVLLAAVAALLAGAVVGLRAHWATATAHDAAGGTPLASAWENIPGDVLGLQLRALQERTAEQVNRAVRNGREDLAHELSEAYAAEALRAITAAGLPPAAPRV